MPNGELPYYRFINKENDTWKELGVAWKLSKSETFSATLKHKGENITFLIVPNIPRAQRRAGASDPA